MTVSDSSARTFSHYNKTVRLTYRGGESRCATACHCDYGPAPRRLRTRGLVHFSNTVAARVNQSGRMICKFLSDACAESNICNLRARNRPKQLSTPSRCVAALHGIWGSVTQGCGMLMVHVQLHNETRALLALHVVTTVLRHGYQQPLLYN